MARLPSLIAPGTRVSAVVVSAHSEPIVVSALAAQGTAKAYLTVGTADSNGKPTKSNGYLIAEVLPGDPTTAADEAAVKLSFDLKDVRNRSDLSDYTGELSADQDYIPTAEACKVERELRLYPRRNAYKRPRSKSMCT
jgi:hypothetical protein